MNRSSARRAWGRGLVHAGLALLALSGTARAQAGPLVQGDGFDLRLFRSAVDSKGQFTLNGTDLLGAGHLSFGLLLDYGRGLGRVGRAELVDSFFSGTVHANLGLANVLVVGAQLPVHLVSGPANGCPESSPGCDLGALGLPRDQYRPAPGGLSYQGPGDLVLHAKLRWLRGESFPVGLALLLQVGVPLGTGAGLAFAGSPGPWVWPSLALERRLGTRVRLTFNTGVRLPFGTGSALRVDQGTTWQDGALLTFGLGASWRALPILDLVLESYGAQSLTGAGTPLEVVAGAKLFIERNSFLMLGAGTRLTGAPAAADVRAFLGFVFEPSIGDADGDGYRDDVDRCRNAPEDFDTFEDDDGCPDPDNDRDGIRDPSDQCPNVPEDVNGTEDGDGCPDRVFEDRDGDGVSDPADRCPDDPEDRDGFQDDDGCPDPDNDGDRLADIDDLCPDDPEDRDGFEDDDGCPDPDNDRDTIADIRDACPDVPENLNGLDDEDGCPEPTTLIPDVGGWRLPTIPFATDSARLPDGPVERQAIEELSIVIRNQPDLELLEIEGHTDERASDAHNLELSLDRARAVLQAVVARGVHPDRLVAAGYGERCPLRGGHREDSWAVNRRVVVRIIRRRSVGRTAIAAGCAAGRAYIPVEVGDPVPAGR